MPEPVSIAIRRLGRLNGRVITPSGPGYDAARMVFYGGTDVRA